MSDFVKGIKREVAELKFLIHDLRVERFLNEIIHFHATLNTDLEIFNVDQVHAIHLEDYNVLKEKALAARQALKSYSNVVQSFSPAEKILNKGYIYIETIKEICELTLNPLWGRSDKVISSLSAQSVI